MGCLKRKLFRLNAKIHFVQLHMLDRSVVDSITFYSWVIAPILFILFTCLNGLKIIISQWCYGLSLMKKYIANFFTVQM